MSKYEPLWKWIRENKTEDFSLSFLEIETVLGFPIDHSFLSYKKELEIFGFQVEKISIKNKSVRFRKLQKLKTHP